jgi:hypothetical protein
MDTWSMTPSDSMIMASWPWLDAEILAVNSIPSGLSTRSVTTPTGIVLSWYMNSRGALPSTGSAPGLIMTSWPDATVALTLYGTATPLISRRPAPLPAMMLMSVA